MTFMVACAAYSMGFQTISSRPAMVAGGRTGRSAMLLDAGTSNLLADAAILLNPDTAAAVTSTVAAADAAAPAADPSWFDKCAIRPQPSRLRATSLTSRGADMCTF